MSTRSRQPELVLRLRAAGYAVKELAPTELDEALATVLPDLLIDDSDALRALAIPRVRVRDDAQDAAGGGDELLVLPLEISRVLDRVHALVLPKAPAPSIPAPSDPPIDSLSSVELPASSRGTIDAEVAGIDVASENWSPASRSAPQAQLSARVSELLDRAERRVAQAPIGAPAQSLSRISPEEELAALLPAEILEALDEPLAAEDEDEDHEHSPGPPTRSGSARPTNAGPDVRAGTRTGPGTHIGTGLGTAPGGHPEESPETVGRPALSAEGTDVPASTAIGHSASSPPPPESAKARVPTRPPPGRAQLDTAPPPSIPSLRQPALSPLRATLEPRGVPFDAAGEPASISSIPPQSRLSGAPALQPQSTTKPPRNPGTASIPPAPRNLDVPTTLGVGDAIRTLGRAVRDRYSGALAFEDALGMRRVLLKEGDFITAASGLENESLVAFLTERGDLAPEASRLGRRLPQFGRHAGAALIAHGYLRQDELWPVLRAHAEWLIGRLVTIERGVVSIEKQVPGRLEAEPAVFGGATGAEVFVEIVRRAVPADQAVLRLGGPDTQLALGHNQQLLGECALTSAENDLISTCAGSTVRQLGGSAASEDFASVLYALKELGIIETTALSRGASTRPKNSKPEFDAIDEQAVRQRILSRKALVDEGDYFALLGLPRSATGYDIRQAYVRLRREFEPERVLTSGTADLRDVVDEIVQVLEEAYEILSDHSRRERYRKALDASPQ